VAYAGSPEYRDELSRYPRSLNMTGGQQEAVSVGPVLGRPWAVRLGVGVVPVGRHAEVLSSFARRGPSLPTGKNGRWDGNEDPTGARLGQWFEASLRSTVSGNWRPPIYPLTREWEIQTVSGGNGSRHWPSGADWTGSVGRPPQPTNTNQPRGSTELTWFDRQNSKQLRYFAPTAGKWVRLVVKWGR
jgi:hypothetical protein